ncbi:MAG: AI-2E family transporter [Zavarzinella sp.]
MTTTNSNLASVARWIVILAGAWYLLQELAVVLKPLFLAVLCAYVILPAYFHIRTRLPKNFSLVFVVTITVLTVYLFAALIQSIISTLREELPTMIMQLRQITEQFATFVESKSPKMGRNIRDLIHLEQKGGESANVRLKELATLVADIILNALIVGLYLVFILIEAGKFPTRVAGAFSIDYSDKIMDTLRGINQGIANFLTAKVKSSFLLALPVAILFSAVGVRSALVWAALTFFCNFVPYVGSLVGFGIPGLFAFLQLGATWEAFGVVIILLAVHIASASFLEPRIIGKAVGVSPLVILLALSFWGTCWGLAGMLLAVPFTVILKIIFQHVEGTQPIAKIMSDQ